MASTRARRRAAHSRGSLRAAASSRVRASRQHQLVAAAAAALIGVGALVSTVAAPERQDRPSPAAGPDALAVLAPDDGNLQIGDVSVPQLPGRCDDGECYFNADAPLPQVDLDPEVTEVAVKAGKSTGFTVTAFNMDAPDAPAPIVTTGETLKVDQLPPARYQIALRGQPAGGVWQFILVTTRPVEGDQAAAPAAPAPLEVEPAPQMPGVNEGDLPASASEQDK